MNTATWIDLTARLFVAFYFLWSVTFNIGAWNQHIAEFERIGIRPARLALGLGIFGEAAGSVLLLLSQTALFGAWILVVFTAAVDGLFHRYWTFSDLDERAKHKSLLFSHVALIGGLLAIMVPRLT